jgi:CO/xanthine dehydrogenase FAD-binding subunit
VEPITYQRPTALGDALAMLAGPGSRPLAGGTDLVPQLREGRRKYGTIVDLKHIPELGAIAQTADGGWRIGAAVSVLALGRHARLAADHPGLLAAARLIGSLQIQARATLGGNVANASPAGDSLPVLLAHDAVVHARSVSGERAIPAAELFTGYRTLALRPDELIVAVRVPFPARGTRTFFRKVGTRRAQSISKVVFCGAAALERGRLRRVRLAWGSMAPVPLRSRAAEAALEGRPPTAAAAAALDALAADLAPIDDVRSAAAYRATVARHLLAQFLGALDPAARV